MREYAPDSFSWGILIIPRIYRQQLEDDLAPSHIRDVRMDISECPSPVFIAVLASWRPSQVLTVSVPMATRM